ncbi:hypothetical protein VPNG_08528 [Cytospora leucostoma]|uniref:YCII-related domain-containing protein n=1 Tax=Cytospora leucostoma TaxID=1230097 RepID=A0A423W565_9PEZI|nr:hypothetical protein VPNG_08528 [Cytospora leucostoma]
MATAPEANWLIQVPDKPGFQVAQLRQDNLAAHMAYNKVHIDAGRMVLSGPTVKAHPDTSGKPPTITGSVMVWKTHSENEMYTWLGENPYAASGVWDLERATCTPFLCAVRKAI